MGAAWLIITVTSAWFAAKKVNGGCRDRSDKEWHVDEFLGYEYRVVCWFGYIDLESAEKECGYGFGKLASIHSEYENEVVTKTAYGNGAGSGDLTWIGLRKVDGSWRWTDGTHFDYSNWNYTQPDNNYDYQPPELCVQIYRSGQWNDLRCDGRVYQAACKRKYIPPRTNWRSNWESSDTTTTRAPVEMEKVAESWITMEKL